ncbi:MAG: hypothetical protein JXB48_09060 [Candidatus Latescibacteria bacterium]|nr:hypothetical protein [Candidatus Latescibacterota bacterium]
MKRKIYMFFFCIIFIMGIMSLSSADDKNPGKKLIDNPVESDEVKVEEEKPSMTEFHGFQHPELSGSRMPVLVGNEPSRNFIPPEEWGFKPGEHGNKSKLMIMWNLVDYLDMDEDTATNFFPIYNKHNEKRDELMKKHWELVNKIIDNVNNQSISVKELNNLINQLDKLNESIQEARESFLDDAKDVLNDRQFIKLVIFNDKLKKDLFNRYSSRTFSPRSPMDDDQTEDGIKQENRLNMDNNFRRNMESEKLKMDELQKLIHEQQQQIEKQQQQIQELIKKK